MRWSTPNDGARVGPGVSPRRRMIGERPLERPIGGAELAPTSQVQVTYLVDLVGNVKSHHPRFTVAPPAVLRPPQLSEHRPAPPWSTYWLTRAPTHDRASRRAGASDGRRPGYGPHLHAASRAARTGTWSANACARRRGPVPRRQGSRPLEPAHARLRRGTRRRARSFRGRSSRRPR